MTVNKAFHFFTPQFYCFFKVKGARPDNLLSFLLKGSNSLFFDMSNYNSMLRLEIARQKFELSIQFSI